LEGLCYSSLKCAAVTTAAAKTTTEAPLPAQFGAPDFGGEPSTVRILASLQMNGLLWTRVLGSRSIQLAIGGVLDQVAGTVINDPYLKGEVYLLHASPGVADGSCIVEYAYEKPPDSTYIDAAEIAAELVALQAAFADLGKIRDVVASEPLLRGVDVVVSMVSSGAVMDVPNTPPPTTPPPASTPKPSTFDSSVSADESNDSGSAATAVLVIIIVLVVGAAGYFYYKRKQGGSIDLTGNTPRLVVNPAYAEPPTPATPPPATVVAASNVAANTNA
jgi:hypothetical protein